MHATIPATLHALRTALVAHEAHKSRDPDARHREPALLYARSRSTLHFDLGRGAGHTTALFTLAGDGDLVIMGRRELRDAPLSAALASSLDHDGHVLYQGGNVTSGGRLVLYRGATEEYDDADPPRVWNRVWLDRARMYSEIELRAVYQAVVRSDVRVPTFILLG